MKHSQRNSSLTSFKLLIVSLFCSLLSAFSAYGEIPLAKNGKANAEIVIKPNADVVLKYAASELSRWIKEISGAQLKVLNKSGNAPYKILLQVNPKGFPEDLKKLKGNDGYAVRQKGNTIYLFASCSKGVLNGVYKMLFKNSDIIWARPNTKFGTIYSKNPNLTLTKTDYLDVPVYIQRGWQMNPYARVSCEEWQVRNSSNWSNVTLRRNKKWDKYGNVIEYGGGHNLVKLYLRENKYFSKHPDFYPLRKGKRQRFRDNKGGVQLCFTNPEMLKYFIKEVDNKIKRYPEYKVIRIMIEDNYNSCRCKNCLKPIKIANSKSITPKDKAFYSTQFFIFLNKVAKHIKKHYPDKTVLTMAYYFTEIPPKCNLEKNIRILFCPIYRDGKAPVNSPKNKRTNNYIKAWLKLTNNFIFREYYGLAPAFPRPLDAIAIADWQYLNKDYGVNHTYSQMYGDEVGGKIHGPKAWDMNSMYFWVLANGSWNPYVGTKHLRDQFLKRVYGKAADDIRLFYSTIEKYWLKSKGKSMWDDNAFMLWNSVVRDNNLGPKLKQILKRASTKIKHPKRVKMFKSLQKTFLEKLSTQAGITVIKVKHAPEFEPNFKSKLWQKAKMVNNFYTNSEETPQVETEVRALCDNKNLYLGFKCFDSKINKTYCRSSNLTHKQWSRGKKIEIFITGYNKKNRPVYYQAALDVKGNYFDACNKNPKWNGKFPHKYSITPFGWSAMLTIPFETINVKPADIAKQKIMFVRYHFYDCPVRKRAMRNIGYWNKGAVHQPKGFGRIKIQ